MDIKTAIGRLTPYLFIFALLFTGCKKEDQETVIHIRCVTPHNNQPVKGCKVTITEGKMKGDLLSTGFDPIQEFSGITDENGVATIRFHYKKKNKFQYQLSKDYSGITPPNGMTDLDIMLPQGWTDYLDKKQFEFNFEFRVFGRCNIYQKFENTNCHDQFDSIRWNRKNLSEFFYDPFYLENSYPGLFVGCGVVYEGTTNDNNFSSGKYVYKLEINKGGIQTIRYDTITFHPNQTNEVVIQY